MKLSNNFTLEELSKTDTGFINVPNATEADFLRQLCIYVLQPIRDEFGRIKVNSGFRCKAVNDAVGGKSNSQHKKGQAVDIVPLEDTIMPVYRWILDNLQLGCCIIYPQRGFIHVSLPRNNKGNNQALICMNGEYTLYEGDDK